MLSLITTFIEVYKSKSFTKAALSLYVTQSTVTKRVKKLEQELNVTLFEKYSSHKIRATESADIFCPVALKLLHDFEMIKLKLENDFSSLPFGIGCSQEASYFIAQLLSCDWEGFTLKIQCDNTHKILSKVQGGELDFGLVETDFTIIQDGLGDLKFTLLCEEPLVLAGNIDSKNFIYREHEGKLSPMVRKFLRENNDNFSQFISMDNINMIIKCLSTGFGISLLPKQCVPEGIPYEKLSKDYVRKYWSVYKEGEIFPDILNKINQIEKILTRTI